MPLKVLFILSWAAALIVAAAISLASNPRKPLLVALPFVAVFILGAACFESLWSSRPFLLEEKGYTMQVQAGGAGDVSVGSSPDVDIVLDNPDAAPVHALIHYDLSDPSKPGFKVSNRSAEKLLLVNNNGGEIYRDVNSASLERGTRFEVDGAGYTVESLGMDVAVRSDADGTLHHFCPQDYWTYLKLRVGMLGLSSLLGDRIVVMSPSGPAVPFAGYAQVYYKGGGFYLRGAEREDKNMFRVFETGSGGWVWLGDRREPVASAGGGNSANKVIIGRTTYRLGFDAAKNAVSLSVLANGSGRLVRGRDGTDGCEPPSGCVFRAGDLEFPVFLERNKGVTTLTSPSGRITDAKDGSAISEGDTAGQGAAVLPEGKPLVVRFGGHEREYVHRGAMSEKFKGLGVRAYFHLASFMLLVLFARGLSHKSSPLYRRPKVAAFALIVYVLFVIGMLLAFDMGAFMGDPRVSLMAIKQTGYIAIFSLSTLCLLSLRYFIFHKDGWQSKKGFLLDVFHLNFRSIFEVVGKSLLWCRRAVFLLLCGFFILQFMHGEGGISLGIINFQPVEALKLFLVLYVSYHLGNYINRRIGAAEWNWRAVLVPAIIERLKYFLGFGYGPWRPRNALLRRFLGLLPFNVPVWRPRNAMQALAYLASAFLVALVCLNSDFSPAIIVFLFLLATFILSASARKGSTYYYLFSWAPLALLVGGFFLMSSRPVQAWKNPDGLEGKWARFQVWRDLWGNADCGGQLLNGLWNIKAGGAFGSGLGAISGAARMPEVQNDFFLGYIGYKLGFAGIMLLLVTYAAFFVFGWRMMRALRPEGNQRRKLFIAFGLAMLFLQTSIVFGSALGVIPVMGQPLPFIAANSGTSTLLFAAPLSLLMIYAAGGSEREAA